MKKNITKISSKKQIFFIVLTIVLILLCIFCYNLIQTKYLDGNKTKYISTNNRESYMINNIDETLLSNYISKKQNTLIVFWASWCSSCLDEAKDLNSFITNNPDIPVIIVSHDKNISDLENYLKENEYKWFVILDTNKIIRENIDSGSNGIPSSYLLDKDTNILSKNFNTMTEEEFYNFYNLKEE